MGFLIDWLGHVFLSGVIIMLSGCWYAACRDDKGNVDQRQLWGSYVILGLFWTLASYDR